MQRFLVGLLLAVMGFGVDAMAQSVGKIVGRVTDGSNGEGLPGVSILIAGTSRGAATDLDGNYTIINVKPGTYDLSVSFLGYSTQVIQRVEVQFDKTTRIDVKMQEASVSGQEVFVVAERPVVQVDRTTTTAFVSEEKLAKLPVLSVTDAVNLQAGVVDGFFRGGRRGEVSYLVNGVPINNAYSNSASFEIEQNMVSSLEVISGVFNAEYGQAMSGVVNVVTKDVPGKWSGNILAYAGTVASFRKAEYVTRNTEPGSFLAASDFSSERISHSEAANTIARDDIQFSLGGPIVKDKIGLQTTLRYFREDGNYYGRDLFNNDDLSFGLTTSTNPEEWIIGSTGSNKMVSYNNNKRLSFNTGLTYTINKTFKLDYNLFLQQNTFNPYSHDYKYVPDALNPNVGISQNHIAGLRIAINKNSFANLSYSFLKSNNTNELYDQPTDDRYVSPENASANGQFAYRVSGNDLFSSFQNTQTHTVVGDYTNQVNSVVQVKTGFLMRNHEIRNEYYQIRVDADGNSDRSYQELESNKLATNPSDFAVYAQTKIEFKDLIINAGLRMDRFNPDYVIPVDRAQASDEEIPNPENPSEMISNRKAAPVSQQISPRLGIAFPISATGVMRFSAGLFFQSPPFGVMYSNPEFDADNGSNNSFGNAAMRPERTLSFEVGLQQGLTDRMGLEFTMFSKDIRNLASFGFYRDPSGGLLSQAQNIDYGTIKGVTLSLTDQGSGKVSWTLDYTLQFANGSASDPNEAFQRSQTGQSQIFRASALNWDRRHVLNNSVTISDFYGMTISLVNRFRTGTPYTTTRFDVVSFERNNASRPAYFTSDLRVYYKPGFAGKRDVQLFLQVDNLTDSRPEWSVNSDTGLATESFDLSRRERQNVRVGGLNSLQEFYYRQDYFGPPRKVNIGLKYGF
jgi:outer membrane receptor protein involved in Fe transport